MFVYEALKMYSDQFFQAPIYDRKVNPISFDVNIEFRTITVIQYFWSQQPKRQCVALR